MNTCWVSTCGSFKVENDFSGVTGWLIIPSGGVSRSNSLEVLGHGGEIREDLRLSSQSVCGTSKSIRLGLGAVGPAHNLQLNDLEQMYSSVLPALSDSVA